MLVSRVKILGAWLWCCIISEKLLFTALLRSLEQKLVFILAAIGNNLGLHHLLVNFSLVRTLRSLFWPWVIALKAEYLFVQRNQVVMVHICISAAERVSHLLTRTWIVNIRLGGSNGVLVRHQVLLLCLTHRRLTYKICWWIFHVILVWWVSELT